MDRLDQLANYFKEKDRQKLQLESTNTENDNNHIPTMSLQEIKLSCIDNNGYETPELNDKLYLHFRGFRKIENLDQYIGCKALWLDSNGFDKIENLGHMVELRCLYLSKNLIQNIEGLSMLKNLILLDLSNNRITNCRGIGDCLNLQTINLSRNYLASADSIEELQACAALSNIDLTNNLLIEDEEIMKNLMKLHQVVNLSINGNEVVKLKSFRKRMIASMPKLGYLDRPIEEIERICAIAFSDGGIEAETIARNEYREQKNLQRKRDMDDFKAWQRQEFERRAQERMNNPRRIYISEIALEEERIRNEQAQIEADNERRLMSHPESVRLIAERYWELSADSKENKDVDILDLAKAQVLTEHDSNSKDQESSRISKSSLAIDEIHLEVETIESSKDVLLDSKEDCIVAESKSGIVIDTLSPKSQKLDKEFDQKQGELMRKRLVDESFTIFKQQQLKSQQASQQVSSLESQENLDFEMKKQSIDMETNDLNERKDANKLYWTEDMDMKLAINTHLCKFDFEKISQVMINAAMLGEFGTMLQENNRHLDFFSADACRLHWSDLDALANTDNDLDDLQDQEVIYKVFMKPTELGSGQSKQPSFDMLKSSMNSQFPSYLSPPQILPTIPTSYDSDSDEDTSNIQVRDYMKKMSLTKVDYDALD